MRIENVAGIALNGCRDVDIVGVVVGPQNVEIPVLGRYARAMHMLPRLQQLVYVFGNEEVRFSGREAVRQMDLVNFTAMNVSDAFADSDSEWLAVQRLFANYLGVMDGGH